MNQGEIARHTERLQERGFTVLEGLSPAEVERARECVIENAALLRNTRPNPSAGHLAGFHRYPQLEQLHPLVSSNPAVLDILKAATGCSQIRSIGLTDITVNRSQQWHVDLLRGKYQRHLDAETCWGPDGGGVYKVLLYLQPGATLRVVPGAHKTPVPLDDDRRTEPADGEALSVDVAAGEIVLMDIRLRHRGSTEDELRNEEFARNPKILVSTVLGGDRKPLTEAMERGNFERNADWDALHRDGPTPQLAASAEVVELAVRR